DIEAKTNVAVKLTPTPNQLTIVGSARDSAWSTNSDKVYVTWLTRGSKSAYLASVDAKSGVVHVIARDSSKTFIEIGPPTFDPVSWYVTKDGDRKSTRLNSSHRTISYAVFCLKKKKKMRIYIYQKQRQKQIVIPITQISYYEI